MAPRRFNPAVPAIVCSGYSNDPAISDPERFGFQGVLVKPCRAGDIIDAVAGLLSNDPVAAAS